MSLGWLQWSVACPRSNAEVAAVLARRQKHQRCQNEECYEMDGSPLQVRDLSSILFASSFQFV